MSRIVVLVAVLVGITSQKEVVIKNEKCRTCNFLVNTFDEVSKIFLKYCDFSVFCAQGLKKTARQHFAGGDTAWEEKNLGKYKTR